MKTWQMIKELTENPGKKFKRVGDELEISVDIDDSLIWKSGYSPLNIYEEWEEVKKPVSFMEAVASGERIWCPDLFGDEEYLKLDDVLTELGSNYYSGEVKDIILNGKFYIED